MEDVSGIIESGDLSISDIAPSIFDKLSTNQPTLYSHLGSNKTVMHDLPIWINHYRSGDFNEIHNHTSVEYQAKCTHTCILILDAGIDEYITVYVDGTPTTIRIHAGDCFILENSVLHGLNTVKDRVIAIMIGISD
jgi:hypothetical protein